MSGRHREAPGHPDSRRRVRRTRVALPGPWRPTQVPVVFGALTVVPVLDLVRGSRPWPTVVVGLLDEPAHLATTVLVLSAVARTAGSRLWAWALVGSVLIDLDHVPFHLGWDPIVSPVGRPVTHSLIVVAALLACAGARRWRTAALGLALGVVSHLLRDLATGPGVPLVWPLSDTGVAVPYAVYWSVLVLAALVALATADRPVTISDRGGAAAADDGSAGTRTAHSRSRADGAGGPHGRARRNTSSPDRPPPEQSALRSTPVPDDPPVQS